MNLKKKFAAAMACVMATGALAAMPIVNASADNPWMDIMLVPSTTKVVPGETFTIDVVIGQVTGSPEVAGMSLKLANGTKPGNGGIVLKSISEKVDAFNADIVSNIETGEAAFATKDGSGVVAKTGTKVVTYTYQVNSDAAYGDYTFALFNDDISDTNGNLNTIYHDNFTVPWITVVKDKNQSGSSYTFVTDYPANITPGGVFSVNVVYKGDTMDLAGFQWQLDVPAEYKCLGLASTTNSKGMELTFNPETYEIASATKTGAPVSFSEGAVVATINFQAPSNYAASDKKITVNTDSAAVSDNNGNVIYPVNVSSKGLLGDANLDGKVDSSDASAVLAEYAELATTKKTTFKDPQQKINADVNFDSKIDATDASDILAYYSFLSTGGKGDMENWIANYKNKK